MDRQPQTLTEAMENLHRAWALFRATLKKAWWPILRFIYPERRKRPRGGYPQPPVHPNCRCVMINQTRKPKK